MINNLKIKKELMRLGMTTVALVNGALSLGCGKVVEAEEIKEVVSIVERENTELTTATPEITVTPSSTPTTSSTNTPEPTEEPSPTPYDPYTLSDEEAIEMGTYIYENYIVKYQKNKNSGAAIYSDYYGKDDIINFVCLFNQKFPTMYDGRRSSCSTGDMYCINSLHEMFLDATADYTNCIGNNHLFPYSLFMKEGRPEKVLLQELEEEFEYITNNDVTDDEMYKYWGKIIKMAINVDETLKDWHPFNYLMFYYTFKAQFCYAISNPNIYNGFNGYISSSYVFDNNKNVKLDIFDAFYMQNTVNKSKYSGLTNQEFNAYAGCFEEFADQCYINNDNDNYIKQRIKDSN